MDKIKRSRSTNLYDLIDKQFVFVQEYLKNNNATQAAIRAGYSKKTAGKIGYQLLENPRIYKAIQKEKDKAAERNQVSMDRVIQEYKRLAFHDIRKLYDENGNLKPIHELDDDTAAALSGLEHEELYAKKQNIGRTSKLKLASKQPALADLMRHLGGFEKDNQQKSNNEKQIAAMAAMVASGGAEERTRLLKTILNS